MISIAHGSQAWKRSDDLKILNGNGQWKWSHKWWIFSTDGSIKDYATGNVLGTVNEANSNVMVELQTKSSPLIDSQKWIAGVPDENGWFTLRSSSSGKVLTASSINTLTLEGTICAVT